MVSASPSAWRRRIKYAWHVARAPLGGASSQRLSVRRSTGTVSPARSSNVASTIRCFAAASGTTAPSRCASSGPSTLKLHMSQIPP